MRTGVSGRRSDGLALAAVRWVVRPAELRTKGKPEGSEKNLLHAGVAGCNARACPTDGEHEEGAEGDVCTGEHAQHEDLRRRHFSLLHACAFQAHNSLQ